MSGHQTSSAPPAQAVGPTGQPASQTPPDSRLTCRWAGCKDTAESIVLLFRPCCGKRLSKVPTCAGHMTYLEVNHCTSRELTRCKACNKRSYITAREA